MNINKIAILAEESLPVANELSLGLSIAFTVIGFLALGLAIGILIYYIKKRRVKGEPKSNDFAIKTKKVKYEIFNFWINYVYIFLIVVGFIAAVVLIPLGIIGLVGN